MNYRLDAYGNLINDGDDSQSLFSLEGESRLLTRTLPIQPTLPPTSSLTQTRNQIEFTYTEALENWSSTGDELMASWEAEGNRRIDDWVKEGNYQMEGWKETIGTHISAYFTPPTPPTLPTPPVMPSPPIIRSEVWQRKRDGIIRNWRRRKEAIRAAWNRKKDVVRREWGIEKDRFCRFQKR